MISTLFVCSFLSACSTDLLAPGAEDVNANIRAFGLSASAVTITVPDSSVTVGDTVRAKGFWLAGRAGRQPIFSYRSSDSAIALVDKAGLVTARAPGRALITAISTTGRATVAVAIVAKPVVVPPAPPVVPPQQNLPTGLPTFNAPVMPEAQVETRMPQVTGRTIRVAAGDAAALQAALNRAVGGDEVVLPNGSQFIGAFKLPKHAGSAPVIVRSETVGVSAGTRVTPATASGFATLVTRSTEGAVAAQDGAANWRLVGLNIVLRAGTPDNYGIVTLGTGTETAASQFVSNIVLDRVVVAGGETGSTSRCVSFNGNALAVIDSWLSDCHAKGRDAQGVGGWTGVGPFLIENSHIEGSGQAVMFGGADPRIRGVVPSDITIRGNHFFKPMSWGRGRWTVKATFELKNAKRVLFEGNVLENHWADAQVGFAILLQGANQSGTAPWSKVQDITVRNNHIVNSTSGINVLSRINYQGLTSDEPMQRVLIRNNLFSEVGVDPVSGAKGVMVQLLSDHEDVTFIQNTFVGAGAKNAVMFDGLPSKRLTLFNNVFGETTYGIFGSGSSEGLVSINKFAPGALVSGNVLTKHIQRIYPAQNFFPASLTAAEFVNAAGGDFTLRATLPYAANGGTTVGVNAGPVLAAARTATAR